VSASDLNTSVYGLKVHSFS